MSPAGDQAGSAHRPRAAVVAVVAVAAVVALASPGAGAQGAPTTSGVADDEAAPRVELALPAGEHVPVGRSVPVEVTVTAGDRRVDGRVVVRTGDPDADLDQRLARFGIGVDGAGLASLLATVPAAPAKVTLDVEVAPRTTLARIVVLPVSSGGGEQLQTMMGMGMGPGMGDPGSELELDVDLVVDGDVVDGAALRVSADPVHTTEAVALLPGASALPGRPDAIELLGEPERWGEAHLVAVSPTLVAAGPGALDPFGQVVATADDLASMGQAGRASLVAWVNAGGHLVVSGVVRGPVEGLPEGWSEGDSAWWRVGAGDVRLVGDALAGGRWSSVLGPTVAGDVLRRLPTMQTPMFVSEVTATVPAAEAVAADADFRLPDLGVLTVLLAAYAVVAGPVAFVVLRRRGHQTAAWVVLPTIALGATAAFAVVGETMRPTAEVGHHSVVELADGGGWAASTVLVGSVPGGDTTLRLPPGWAPTVPEGGGAGALEPHGLRGAGDEVSAEVVLDPGGMGIVRAAGPASLAGDLATTAVVVGDGAVSVTVRNDLGVDLHDVVVLTGAQATEVGSLPAGATRDVVVDDPLAVPGRGATVAERAAWPLLDATLLDEVETCPEWWCGADVAQRCDVRGCVEVRPPDPDEADPTASAVSAVAWMDFLRHDASAARRASTVTVAGWSEELPAPVTLADGDAVDTGRTGVVRRARIEPPGEGPATVDRTRVRSVASWMSGQVGVGAGADELVRRPRSDTRDPVLSRVVLPPRLDGEPLDPAGVALRFPEEVDEVGFATPDGWVTYGRTPLSGGSLDVPVPPEAVVTGVVYVRTRGDLWDDPFRGDADSVEPWSLRSIDEAQRAELEADRAEDMARREAFGELEPPRSDPVPGAVVDGAFEVVEIGPDGVVTLDGVPVAPFPEGQVAPTTTVVGPAGEAVP